MRRIDKILIHLKQFSLNSALLISTIIILIILFEIVIRSGIPILPDIENNGFWHEKLIMMNLDLSKDNKIIVALANRFPSSAQISIFKDISIDDFYDAYKQIPASEILTFKSNEYYCKHEILGYSFCPNIRGLFFEEISLDTNSFGARGSTELTNTSNKTKVVFLGDSFTFGSNVDEEESFSYHFGNSSNNVESINLGVPGYGHTQMLLKLLTDVVDMDPDYVVIGFVNTDISRNGLTFRLHSIPKFTIENNKLILKNVPLQPVSRWRNVFRTYNYFEIISHLVSLYSKDIELEKVSNFIFDEMVQISRDHNFTLVFTYLPEYLESMANESNPHPSFTKVCKNDDIICLDPIPRFHSFLQNQSKPDYHFEKHYSPDLHKLVSEEIYEGIIN